jgi:outer membrane protein with beta-barrel domain
MAFRVRSSVLLFALLVALPLPSLAAEGFIVGVHGGATVPSGSFGDYWDTGYMIGGYGEVLIKQAFAIGVDVNYATDNPSDYYVEQFPGSDDSEFTYFNVGAHGKWTYLASGSPLRPYLLGGGGMYSVKEKYQDATTSEEFDQTAFGLMGGIGLSWLATTSFRLELEADYHHVFTSESDIGHSSAPFFGVQAGLAYAFGQKSAE